MNSTTVYEQYFDKQDEIEGRSNNQQSRENRTALIQSIRKKYDVDEIPWDLELLNETELEGVLEFQDPRVFYQKEYTDERNLIDKEHSVHNGTHIMRSDKQMRTDDILLAEKLGGPRMKRRIIYVTGPKNQTVETRRENIEDILDELPDQFDLVVEEILKNDLIKLARFCADENRRYYKPTIRQLLVPLVLRKGRLIGKEYGFHPHVKDVVEALSANRSGALSHEIDLIEAGFYSKEDIHGVEQEAVVAASLNELFRLKHILGDRISQAQQKASEIPSKFPKINNARINLSEIVTIISAKYVKPAKSLEFLCRELLKSGDTEMDDLEYEVSTLLRNVRNTLRRIDLNKNDILQEKDQKYHNGNDGIEDDSDEQELRPESDKQEKAQINSEIVEKSSKIGNEQTTSPESQELIDQVKEEDVSMEEEIRSITESTSEVVIKGVEKNLVIEKLDQKVTNKTSIEKSVETRHEDEGIPDPVTNHHEIGKLETRRDNDGIPDPVTNHHEIGKLETHRDNDGIPDPVMTNHYDRWISTDKINRYLTGNHVDRSIKINLTVIRGYIQFGNRNLLKMYSIPIKELRYGKGIEGRSQKDRDPVDKDGHPIIFTHINDDNSKDMNEVISNMGVEVEDKNILISCCEDTKRNNTSKQTAAYHLINSHQEKIAPDGSDNFEGKSPGG